MRNNSRVSNRHNRGMGAGSILLLVGSALLLRNAGVPIPGWLFNWPSILILVGLYISIKSKFANTCGLIIIGIGGFFLADKFIPGLHLRPYFWPVILISIGIMFMLRPNGSNGFMGGCFGSNTNSSFESGGNPQQTQNAFSSTSTDGNDLLKISSVFSGVKRNIVSKNFLGGRVSCVFGGAEIDLTQADIQGNAEIRFEVAFGGVELIVPAHWRVSNEIDGIFHGVDDERRYNAAAINEPEKILTLRGSVVFGGIEIKSYG